MTDLWPVGSEHECGSDSGCTAAVDEHKQRNDEPGLRSAEAPLVARAAYQRWLARAEQQRDLSAFEESGHWVGGWLVGLDLTGTTVTIVPDGRCWRSVTFDDPAAMDQVRPTPSLLGGFDTDLHDRFRFEATVVVLFTGPLAAGRALQEGMAEPPPAPPPRNSFERRQEQMDAMTVERLAADAGVVGGIADGRKVERLLANSCASPSEAWSYGSWLFARAETMVRSRTFWLPCCAIAEQLLVQGSLTGERCIELAERALRPSTMPETARRWPR